jgi:hemerythrin
MEELFHWSSWLSTGIEKFDMHHQKLIGMVNELHNAMSEGKGEDVILEIMNGLVQYTIEHFNAEEEAMIANNFDGYLEHKTEHEKLKTTVTGFMKKYSDHELDAIDLYEFLTNWVTNHVLITDKKYGPFIKII